MYNELGENSVSFHFEKTNFHLDDRRKLKRFIEFVINKEKKKLVFLNYIFCTDEAILKINRSYLKHDFYTDIISFDLSNSTKSIFGEIYISVDRVKENAQTFKSIFKEEMHRVIFHGILHLCGYKDKTDKEIQIMRKKENFYLNLYKRFT